MRENFLSNVKRVVARESEEGRARFRFGESSFSVGEGENFQQLAPAQKELVQANGESPEQVMASLPSSLAQEELPPQNEGFPKEDDEGVSEEEKGEDDGEGGAKKWTYPDRNIRKECWACLQQHDDYMTPTEVASFLGIETIVVSGAITNMYLDLKDQGNIVRRKTTKPLHRFEYKLKDRTEPYPTLKIKKGDLYTMVIEWTRAKAQEDMQHDPPTKRWWGAREIKDGLGLTHRISGGTFNTLLENKDLVCREGRLPFGHRGREVLVFRSPFYDNMYAPEEWMETKELTPSFEDSKQMDHAQERPVFLSVPGGIVLVSGDTQPELEDLDNVTQEPAIQEPDLFVEEPPEDSGENSFKEEGVVRESSFRVVQIGRDSFSQADAPPTKVDKDSAVLCLTATQEINKKTAELKEETAKRRQQVEQMKEETAHLRRQLEQWNRVNEAQLRLEHAQQEQDKIEKEERLEREAQEVLRMRLAELQKKCSA